MSRRLLIGLFTASAVAAVGCGQFPQDRVPEVVMCEGDRFEVADGDFRFVIEATGRAERRYEIGGYNETVNLVGRGQRWNGSLGLYTPDAGDEMRVVADDGQQHFDSVAEAVAWIDWITLEHERVVTSDGVVVAWRFADSPLGQHSSSLSAKVWQIYVRGERPTEFPSIAEDTLSTSFVQPRCEAAIVSDHVPLQPAEISGRMYSGRAQEIMREQNIPIAHIEFVLENSQNRDEVRGMTIVYGLELRQRNPWLSVYWVQIDADGMVWLVG